MNQTSQVLPIRISRVTVSNLLLAMAILAGSLLAAFIFGLLAYQVYFLNRVYNGVQIDGVDVGRMTRPQVAQRVTEQAEEILRRPVTLQTEAGSVTLSAAEVGAVVDIQRTVELAFSVGRHGRFLADLREQWQALRQPVRITPVLVFSTGPANNVLANLAQTLNRPPQNAELHLRPDLTLEVVPPQMGRTLDVEASRAAIRQAILRRDESPIPLTLHTTPPAITEVEPTRQILETLLSQPLTFTFQQQQWTLPPEELAQMLVLAEDSRSSPGRIIAYFNEAALSAYFHQLAREIDRPPVNAWFHLDTQTWTLIPLVESQDGYALDVPAAVAMVVGLLQDPSRHQLPLPVIVQPPAVPTATAEELGIRELVSSATSYFKGSSAGRVQNIEVAASKFHGLVIPPGEVFSFNQYLGDVTAENGFVESLIIQGDRTAVGIGGGVCQVSTTVFRAAFFGGFEIVERWAHGYRVSWYETGSGPGLDATIYSPTVDFKFRNDTDSYILIQTYTDATAGTLTFSFYGTSPNRTVIVSEPELSNVVPHGPDIYQEDPSLAPGEIKQVDWAKDGVDVTVHRTVMEGETVIHQDTIFSRYRPWQNVYKIGPSPD